MYAASSVSCVRGSGGPKKDPFRDTSTRPVEVGNEDKNKNNSDSDNSIKNNKKCKSKNSSRSKMSKLNVDE